MIGFSVAQRTHEMGVRLALGARASSVVRMVLGEGLRVALIGIGFGAVAALVAGRFAALLFGVRPHDPGILATAAGVLLLAAVVASLVPAWRATRVNPNQALRVE